MNNNELTYFQQKIKSFVEVRKWETNHNPKCLSMSISIEASELMEIFQWMTIEESKNIIKEDIIEHIGEEIADVMIYCISMANQFNFDVATIINDKIDKNALKYPE